MEKFTHRSPGRQRRVFLRVPKAPKLYRNQAPSGKLRRALHDKGRPNARARGYDRQWEKVRAVVLARDPVCKACERRLSVEADHITPLAAGGARLDPKNCQGLCKPCHTAKTNRERAAGVLDA
jgi:5-methylcytosine-specific restriction protein A